MAIRNRLSRLLGDQRIRASELSRKTGISKNALSKLYNERSKGIEFETLNKLCKALKCSVGDLLEYVPDGA